jgi:hypothetical protein
MIIAICPDKGRFHNVSEQPDIIINGSLGRGKK